MNNQEILDLWESILDDNDISDKERQIFFSTPERVIKGSRSGVSNIWYKCKTELETIEKDESLSWLTELIIKQYISYSIPLLHISLEDVLNGKMERVEALRKLLKETEDMESEKIWKEKQSDFIRMAAAIGITLEKDDVNDPVSIATVLLEAGKRTDIKKVRDGKHSKKNPVISEYVYSVANEKSFIRLLEQENHECCLVMAHIRESEKSYREYNNTYDSNFCFGIKDGENIFLVYEYGQTGITKEAYFYEFGKRTSYMPYQLFFEGAAAPEGSTFLSLSDEMKSWHLPEVLDQEQKIFFPVFISTIMQKTIYKPVEMEVVPLYNETEVHFEDGTVMLPATRKETIITIDSLDDIVREFSSTGNLGEKSKQADARTEATIKLMHYFNVDPKDFDESKFARPNMNKKEKYESDLRYSIYKQIYAIIEKKLQIMYHGQTQSAYQSSDLYKQDKEKCMAAMYARQELILEKMISGELDDCMTIRIHKGNLFTESGKPVCHRNYYELEQLEQYNTVEDGRLKQHKCAVYLPETLEDRIPPVKIEVEATTPEEITLLTGLPKEEFPEFVKIQDYVNLFFQHSNHNCYFPISVSFCMGKKEYKKYFSGKYIKPSMTQVRGNGKESKKESEVFIPVVTKTEEKLIIK